MNEVEEAFVIILFAMVVAVYLAGKRTVNWVVERV